MPEINLCLQSQSLGQNNFINTDVPKRKGLEEIDGRIFNLFNALFKARKTTSKY